MLTAGRQSERERVNESVLKDVVGDKATETRLVDTQGLVSATLSWWWIVGMGTA